MANDFDTAGYLDSVIKESGLDEQQAEVLRELARNDDFSKTLARDVLARQDYSRNMDALRDRQTELEKQEQYFQMQASQDHNNAQYVAKLKADLEAAQTSSSSSEFDFESGEFDTKAFEARIERKLKEQQAEMARTVESRDRSWMDVIAQTATINSSYQKEFGDVLDTQKP